MTMMCFLKSLEHVRMGIRLIWYGIRDERVKEKRTYSIEANYISQLISCTAVKCGLDIEFSDRDKTFISLKVQYEFTLD